MKKIIFSLIMVITLVTNMFGVVLASSTISENEAEMPVFEERLNEGNEVTSSQDDKAENVVEGAGEKIIGNMTKKDRKIKEYTDKFNNSTNAHVAYYLDLAQLYSIPVCVIGIAIGAFNFYIIGDKKLDKKEQGFGFIMSFLCGLVFFQVLPFVFALLVAGK